ncbi:Zn-binding Pro-Ala-Ala-Arg (PAAR) domain-containing protein, incolved in TypeVI secretion [Lysobacter sp. yr284]|uniref:PAAR domain-containing protein n=1 Tax=Lysobacter sp. yr284 TaxID=1761791 RepID=UPI00089D20F7|nr:PAAR domain-containing protein [Lysobacter sp. yr284]SDY68829.1 Zn-binding Pro-Ala-Ala-Arg (PAAR) domain-containing protein, incolved in TypeVI secretion [Lysobacter sp. yr284]
MAARLWIVVGDTTSSGGQVVSGSPFTDIDGKPVARIGDSVVCGLHGPTVVATGDAAFIVDGQPLARERDGCACGCLLVSVRQVSTSVAAGGAGGGAMADGGGVRVAPDAVAGSAQAASAALGDEAGRFDEQLRFSSVGGLPLALTRYAITLGDGQVLQGTTDEDGKTARIVTDRAQAVIQAKFFPPDRMRTCCAQHVGASAPSATTVAIAGVQTNAVALGTSQAQVTVEGESRGLTEGEQRLARRIFQNAIDCDKVKIHNDEYLWFGMQDDKTAMTPNGEIWMPKALFREDYSAESEGMKHLFVHEMVHVWQYQLGYGVKANGMKIHALYEADGLDYRNGFLKNKPVSAYVYSLKPRQQLPLFAKPQYVRKDMGFVEVFAALSDFNMEQQGDIIADYAGHKRYLGPGKPMSASGRAIPAGERTRWFEAVLAGFLAAPSSKSLIPSTTKRADGRW